MQQTLTPSEGPTLTALASPRMAVVVPIYRHSVLLVEAIESVLDQNADFGIQLVLVNDGCPHVESDLTCREYASSYPDRIAYLRKPNGGLSDARNHGIRYALDRWPSVEAIYMLDADNRLRKTAMANALAELDRHPEAGWIYPNIDMFGLRWSGDYGGDYSLLVHTAMNICEAGSLIRRDVFDAGIFFDTSFKSGFEDWDFFLSAAQAGFRGRNLRDFGFLYRKRAESMLADSEREGNAIRSEMRKKHRSLYTPRNLLRLEQLEAPRYAIYLADRHEILMTVDPDSSEARTVPFAEFEEQWWRAQSQNTQHHIPPILVVTETSVLDQLRRAKLLHSVLWTMERRLVFHPYSALEIEPWEADRFGWDEEVAQNSRKLQAAMLMVRPGVLNALMTEKSLEPLTGLTADPCTESVSLIRVNLPSQVFSIDQVSYTAAAHEFIAFATRCHAASGRGQSASFDWDWRRPDISWRKKTHEIVRQPTRSSAAYPRIGSNGRDVGFLLPLLEFGGVERVALNIASAMKRAGWRPHLFILDSNNCQFSEEWRDIFESITFLADSNFRTWGPSSTEYLGTDIPDWARYGDHGDALAMMAWLDVIINLHGGAISGAIGKLKHFGVQSVLSLHLSDLTEFKRPVGNTYLGLAFEHSYDFVVPCSNKLADWCHGMGVPEAKIIAAPNAPGFELPDDAAKRIDARRSGRSDQDPLRAVYLGRLDHQKGVDRLISVIQMSKAMGLPVEWRLIGKSVIGGQGVRLPSDIASFAEPPQTTPEGLAEIYEWADVLVLPSYFEGLPLTILEAMRSGVIPIATDAGAVTEVVKSWTNGVVVSQDGAVSEILAALTRLTSEPGLVTGLSNQARADLDGRDWDAAMAPLIQRLEDNQRKAKSR